MATPGDYLVYQTVDDCTALVAQLEQCKRTIWRIVERMDSLGTAALAGFQWANGYDQASFVDLYQALNALPDFVIDDDTRDEIFQLLSCQQ